LGAQGSVAQPTLALAHDPEHGPRIAADVGHDPRHGHSRRFALAVAEHGFHVVLLDRPGQSGGVDGGGASATCAS
jgi:predicted alpha/beta hydrolase